MLSITSEPTAKYPSPKIGCPQPICATELDYILQAGQASQTELVINLFGAISNGDTLSLNGYIFTFVSATPTIATQIQISGASTYANLYNRLLQIPFFADNYIITTPVAFVVKLVNKRAIYDGDYSFDSSTANADAVIQNPFFANLQGQNPIVKNNYYANLRLLDELGTVICAQDIERPLQLLADGTNKVCFDIAPMIDRYVDIKTLQPIPYYQNTSSTSVDIFGFDRFYKKRYSAELYATWQNQANESQLEVRQRLPSISFNWYEFVNFLQDADTDDFRDYSWDYYISQGQNPTVKWITSMPKEYLVCYANPIEARIDIPVYLLSIVGANIILRAGFSYADGSILSIDIPYGVNDIFIGTGVQVLHFNFATSGILASYTSNAGSPLIRAKFVMIQDLLGVQSIISDVLEFNFDVANKSDVCCSDSSVFYFVSSTGNNDLLVGGEIIDIAHEYEYAQTYKQLPCGQIESTQPYFIGGQTNTMISSDSKVYTTYLSLPKSQYKYLEEFLRSPTKYFLRPPTEFRSQSIYSIVPVDTNYQIKLFKNSKLVVAFKWKYSMLRRSLNQ